MSDPERPDQTIDFFLPGPPIQSGTYICNESGIAEPWDGYALAYLEAAKYVFKGIQKNDLRYPNTIGYSFFFLYRHYLELRIKELIKNGSILLNMQVPDEIFEEHNLTILWNKHCVPILRKSKESENGPGFP